MVVPRTINDQEAGSSFSMSLEKEGNEKINNDCTRRSSCEWIFGRGFDSHRLHQIKTQILIQLRPPCDEVAFVFFERNGFI